MRVLWAAVGVSAAVVAMAGCASHTHRVASGPGSTSAASEPVTTVAPASPAAAVPSHLADPATVKVVVRPVDRAGRLSPGYSAVTESDGDPVVCDRHYASPVAVDAGIIECGDSALYGVACWPAATVGTVLCDRDPFGRQLAQLPAQFVTELPVMHAPAVPFGLVLDNGEQCRIREGGAWPRLNRHPSYVGYYRCGPDSRDAVWAPPNDYKSGGINQSSPQWTVAVGSSSGQGALVRHRVVTALFVGMAR